MLPAGFEPTIPVKQVAADLCLLGSGYFGAGTDTTEQSGQTPDKEADIYHVTVHVSGYIETDTTGKLSPKNGRLSGANKVGLMWSKKPSRCHLVLYLFLLYKLLNMFRATLCPSSGADGLVVFLPRVV